MSYFDYIIITVLLVGFILGFKDGLVRKIIGLAGIIIGAILAVSYATFIGSYLAPIFNDEIYLSEIVAGIVIFFLTVFVASVIKRIIHPLDKVNRFLNQFMGGLTGALQILFFLSGFLLFLDIFNIPSDSEKDNSVLYTKVHGIIPTAIDFIVGEDYQKKNFIKDYIEAKDTASIAAETTDTTLITEGENDIPDSTEQTRIP